MIFKVLALRLHTGSPLKKNLTEKFIYKFSDDYKFFNDKDEELNEIDNHSEIARIDDNQTFPIGLYRIKEEEIDIDITISAIVGRNGAGKSSLLEAFYLIIFCLSESKRMIHHRTEITNKIKKSIHPAAWKRLYNDAVALLQDVNMDLYYRIAENYYLIRRQSNQTESFILTESSWAQVKFEDIPFFYSIVVNYSQYSLNAVSDYYWLKPLFHKNDGYITPIVLNPFRDSGNIDINREVHLAQIRMLTNLSHDTFTTTKLIDDKNISNIIFHIRPAANGILHDLGENFDSISLIDAVKRLGESPDEAKRIVNNVNTLLQLFEKLLSLFDPEVKKKKYYQPLYSALSDYLGGNKTAEVGRKIYDEDEKTIELKEEDVRLQQAIYILTKTVKICNKYPGKFDRFSVRQYYQEDRKTVTIYWIRGIGLANALFRDDTHITLKLKQSINTLLADYLSKQNWSSKADDQNNGAVAFSTVIDFKKVIDNVRNAFKTAKYENKHLSHFVPAAFFAPQIEIFSSSNNYLFDKMSSGEQQLIHSVHSILYHILNLNSINKNIIDSRLNKDLENVVAKGQKYYDCVNVILDEIELYYHPIYQRRFIDFLLENLKKINLRYIRGINILFSTHSPFILSDIPRSNVLRLQAGQEASFQENQTFGSNIHDMLSDSFFLDHGLIGAFAEAKINECINGINQLRLLKNIQEALQKQDDDTGKIVKALKDEIKSRKFLIHYKTYHEAADAEQESRHIHHLIELVGEAVMRFKLREMYEDAMPDDQFARDEAKRQIRELMERNNLKREDI